MTNLSDLPENAPPTGTDVKGDDIPDINVAPGVEPIEAGPAADDAGDKPVEPPEGKPEDEGGAGVKSDKPEDQVPASQGPNYQALYDGTIGRLKDYLDPVTLRQFKAEVRADVEKFKGQQLMDVGDKNQLETASETPESIYDMPANQFFEQIGNIVDSRIAARESAQMQNRAKDFKRREIEATNKVYADFVKEGAFTEEQQRQAFSTILGLMPHIDVSDADSFPPGQYASLMNLAMRELRNIGERSLIDRRVAEQKIESGEQDKNLLNTMQPSGGTPPPVPPKTEQDGVIDLIRSTRKGNLSSLPK